MDYQNILKLWDKNKCFIVENDRIKPKKYIYTPFFRANSNGFNNADIRRLISSDVLARYYRFNYNNVLFPTGYNTLANTSFIETRRLNDTTDNISDIFNNQMLRLGIGINSNKDIYMNSNEYLSLLQQSFIDLYQKGYIKYGDCKCYYDENKTKVFDRINKPVDSIENQIKAFYLDISKVIEIIRGKIENIEIDNETKSKLTNYLNPKTYMCMDLAISTGEELSVKLYEPETLGGLSYILINPEYIDITNYIDPSEESSIIKFLNNDEINDVVFTGVYAKNPLTGMDIPIFISMMYDKEYHLGIPSINFDDRKFANINGLDIIEILDDDILVDSDFISGYTRDIAREMIIEAFVEAEIATIKEEYEHTEILVSSLDDYGALFPFLQDKEHNKIYSLEGYLPYAITDKLRAELDSSCDIVGSKMAGTINNLYIEGVNPVLAILYDDIGFMTSIFSDEAKKEYIDWNTIDYLIIKEEELVNSLFMQFVFQAILEYELDIKFNTPKTIVTSKQVLDNKGMEISKKNNNILDFDKILNTYMVDAIRMYSLSKLIEEEFIFDLEGLKIFNDLTINIYDVLSNDLDSKKHDIKIYNLAKRCLKVLENKDTFMYVKLINDFFSLDIKGFNDEHTLLLLKLIYPICPFISEEIYIKRFNGKYSITNEDYIEI